MNTKSAQPLDVEVLSTVEKLPVSEWLLLTLSLPASIRSNWRKRKVKFANFGMNGNPFLLILMVTWIFISPSLTPIRKLCDRMWW